MLQCPRCQAPIELSTIQCPRCQLTLKAHGHPGIPLHRPEGDEALCMTCQYDVDDTCNFPQRPQAQTCTLYRSINKSSTLDLPSVSKREEISFWLRNHRGTVGIAGLLLLSLALVLARQ